MTAFTPHTPLSGEDARSDADESPRLSGAGRLLVVVYAILALAATARSLVQILTKFNHAPLAYSLSAVAALVYILATVALARHHRPGWHRIALLTIGFELVGVLVVGALTTWAPQLFISPDAPNGRIESTVWSWFGMGYGFIPLVLPVLGLWWLAKHRPGMQKTAGTADTAAQTDAGRDG
ncbi:hypothetical protein [Pseudoclavibacter sp. 13-3]|uniref:hypothetical protein n=1 Tax=Pseudoclavibacter sp. 13-3 TaxID=2901228 RepID=UPI001E2B6D64|nr:hypothetical protein [Pseudoclavibacter sp. 13-3]MCD7101001.1 hypothetical protein [Pseudoclavibacter sp. 13-3]